METGDRDLFLKDELCKIQSQYCLSMARLHHPSFLCVCVLHHPLFMCVYLFLADNNERLVSGSPSSFSAQIAQAQGHLIRVMIIFHIPRKENNIYHSESPTQALISGAFLKA